MVMFVRKIGTEFYFVVMILFILCVHGLSSYRTESVIMAVAAFSKDSGTSCQLVNMFLFTAFAWLSIHNENLFFSFFYPMQD